ncbi:MAG TPA: hypothetical protein VFE37_24295 [Chloroflexota bacterium]|nr:hypothetical protein [Chloroflexota bacterium]
MAMPPTGASLPQLVEQVYSALAASHATIELSFENLEVVLPRDGAPDIPPARWLLNGTLRLRATTEG